MATATLVNNDIEIGRRIVSALTLAEIPVTVYLWAFVPQLQEWQFMIATPLIDTKGPLAAYGEVNKALQKQGVFDDVPFRRIFLKSPSDRVLKSLERLSKTVPQETFRVVNEEIAGTFVEDAYVYNGSIHVIRLDESTPDPYWILYAPYQGRGGARPAEHLDGIEQVREFLKNKVRIRKEVLEPRLKQLMDRGGASIKNVQLKPQDLRRLGLA
jgi:hypothetical protein